jgi:hypothetical protein
MIVFVLLNSFMFLSVCNNLPMRRGESSDLQNGLEKTGLRQLDLPVEPLPSPHLRLERGRVRSRDLRRPSNMCLRNRMVSLITMGSLVLKLTYLNITCSYLTCSNLKVFFVHSLLYIKKKLNYRFSLTIVQNIHQIEIRSIGVKLNISNQYLTYCQTIGFFIIIDLYLFTGKAASVTAA